MCAYTWGRECINACTLMCAYTWGRACTNTCRKLVWRTCTHRWGRDWTYAYMHVWAQLPFFCTYGWASLRSFVHTRVGMIMLRTTYTYGRKQPCEYILVRTWWPWLGCSWQIPGKALTMQCFSADFTIMTARSQPIPSPSGWVRQYTKCQEQRNTENTGCLLLTRCSPRRFGRYITKPM